MAKTESATAKLELDLGDGCISPFDMPHNGSMGSSMRSVPVIKHKPLRYSHFREAFVERLLAEDEETDGASRGRIRTPKAIVQRRELRRCPAMRHILDWRWIAE